MTRFYCARRQTEWKGRKGVHQRKGTRLNIAFSSPSMKHPRMASEFVRLSSLEALLLFPFFSFVPDQFKRSIADQSKCTRVFLIECFDFFPEIIASLALLVLCIDESIAAIHSCVNVFRSHRSSTFSSIHTIAQCRTNGNSWIKSD